MKRGFTLVELSIVLVIVGLLIGGILIAQSLIGTVKIQRLVRDLGQYEISTNNFRINYRAYPGDSATFDLPGNRDGRVGSTGLSPLNCVGTKYYDESMNFFAHLSQAGMIKTSYEVWEPDLCGGLHSNNNDEMAGVLTPYTELGDRAVAAGYWYRKNIIWPISWLSNADNVGFRLIVDVDYVAALEAKLGSAAFDASAAGATGLTNYSETVGMCLIDVAQPISCSDPTANYGAFIYFLGPV